MVVADTGPLIALACAGRLELLREQYAQVSVPPMVQAELAIDSGRPGAKVVAGEFAAGVLLSAKSTGARAEVGSVLEALARMGYRLYPPAGRRNASESR